MSRRRNAPRPPEAGGAVPTGRVKWVAVAVVAALVAAGVVSTARRGPQKAPIASDPGLNVLLVTIDTLRADALGSYGKADAGTPVLDRVARLGVRFARAHAHNVVTLPSHANILTGRLPYQHGIRDNSGFRLPTDVPTLATILKARGYATGAFVSGFPLDSRFGLPRGFDEYDDRLGDTEARPTLQMEERAGASTVAAALDWIRGHGDAPYLCWVHLYEPHAPYRPPPEAAALHPGEPYQGEVSAGDAALGPLMAPLMDAGGAGRTLIVVTADHGEALGDHGERTHGILTYEPVLRVPLLLFHPRLPPRVVEDPVRHVDILPTILAAVGASAPAGLAGRSLWPLAVGDRLLPETTYFESLTPALTRGRAPARGVFDGRWKYILLPIAELYDLASDPAETRNVVATRPAEAARLRAVIEALPAAGSAAPAREAAEVRERLAALGYASGGGALKQSYTLADDPKRLVGLDWVLDEVLDLYQRGELEAARRRCEWLVAQRPDTAVYWRHAAFLARESGDLAAAVDAARRAVRADPDSSDNAATLGNYLNDAGRPTEAVSLLTPFAAASVPDLDVLMALGAALAKSGRRGEGRATLERARSIDPSNALVWLNLGTVELLAGNLDDARSDFEAALAREPELSRAYNSLGVIAARRGDGQAAVRLLRRAVDMNPQDYDALFNLGVLLRRQGRPAEARPYLEQFLKSAPPALYATDFARVRAWLRP